jgi:hypothetical protein
VIPNADLPPVGFVDHLDLLRCTLFNARSLSNKWPEFHKLLYTGNFEIILVTETWLNVNIPKGFVDPENQFHVLRNDRTHGKGGGVCAVVSKSLDVIEIPIYQYFPNLEVCCFDVFLNETRCRLFNVYRRPAFDPECVEYMVQLINCFTKFANTKGPCIIAGDLNCPGIDWMKLCSPNDCIQDKLLNFAVTNGFIQVVLEPTRLCNTLDIVLTNEPVAMCDVSVEAPFTVNCDHCQVNFCLSFDPGTYEFDLNVGQSVKQFLWKEADFSGMSDFISQIDWFGMLSVCLTPNAIWESFSSVMNMAIEKFVPVRFCPLKSRAQRAKKIYPRKIKRAQARKLCLWQMHKVNLSDENLLVSYRKAEDSC